MLELAASKVAHLHRLSPCIGTHDQSFVDLDFPPTAASLGGLGAGARRYAWRRPAAFAGERGPSIFGRSISSGDVDQGERLCEIQGGSALAWLALGHLANQRPLTIWLIMRL